jgi:hypothetical protein
MRWAASSNTTSLLLCNDDNGFTVLSEAIPARGMLEDAENGWTPVMIVLLVGMHLLKEAELGLKL